MSDGSNRNLQGCTGRGTSKRSFSCPQDALQVKRLFPRGYDAQGDSRERLRTCMLLKSLPRRPGSTQTGHPAFWSQPCLLCTPSRPFRGPLALRNNWVPAIARAWASTLPRRNAQQPPMSQLCHLSLSSTCRSSSPVVETKRKAVSPTLSRKMHAACPLPSHLLLTAAPSSFPPVAVEHTSTLCLHARRGDVPRMHVSRSRTAGGRARGSLFPIHAIALYPLCMQKSDRRLYGR